MSGIRLKTPQEIEAMRTGGKILATILKSLKDQAQIGMSPKDLSAIAKQQLRELGGEPAFLGYQGYPDVICISVNNQVQHSIPTEVPLADGDLVNLDFGVRYKNMVTDGGISFCLGKASQEKQYLLRGTEESLQRGLKAIRNGRHVGDVSAAIEAVLKRYKLGIVRELVGHGVGHELHEEPEVPNYGSAGQGPILKTGMTIAIEPIATLGREEIMGDKDGWTLWTVDGSDSAQFEHTVLVTDNGCEVLTKA